MADPVMFLTEQEIASLLVQARKNSISDFALLLTVYELGTRATEAASIRRDEIDWKRATIVIRVLKRSKRPDRFDENGNPMLGPDGRRLKLPAKPPPRIECAVSAALLEVLKAHLTIAPESEWLFPKSNTPLLPIDRSRVKYVYYKAAHALGFGKPREWHPHLLRHSKGTLKALSLARKGVGALEAVKAIQETLRQASESAALKYIHATSEAMQKSREADEEMTTSILAKVFDGPTAGTLGLPSKKGEEP